MILAIDIGNTTIGLALMENHKIKSFKHVDTLKIPSQLKTRFRKILNVMLNSSKCVNGAIICSVVPEMTILIERWIKEYLNIPTQVIGRDITVPMINRYKNPKQVGQDRLVGAYAATKLYGKPLIVVDLGTAITFDVISSKGEYLGGSIVPGLRLSAESLFAKTALLPQIDIKAPKSVIGRTTQESILSGLFYGYGVMCQGMIDLLSKNISSSGKKTQVVMTGGHTQLMKKFVSSKIRIIDEYLVFKGISLLIK